MGIVSSRDLFVLIAVAGRKLKSYHFHTTDAFYKNLSYCQVFTAVYIGVRSSEALLGVGLQLITDVLVEPTGLIVVIYR